MSHSMTRRSGNRSCRFLYLVLAIIVVFALFLWTPLPGKYDVQREALVQHVSDTAKNSIPHGKQPVAHYPSLSSTKSKYAFATFLAGDFAHPDDPDIPDMNSDDYFVAVRILAYQLLHASETRSNTSIPFVVLVTAKVNEEKRERLRRDGAIVHEAEPIFKPDWIQTEFSAWQDVFDKLRLWELTQFDRIAFLDADTVLTRPLDGIFQDPAVATQQTLTDPAHIEPDESAMPFEFALAGQPEMLIIHHYPPSEATHDYPNIDYLNAGFFVLQPSLELLSYYLSIMQTPNRFVPRLPEQNLLNYAHRREGNMPWKQLAATWSMHYATVADLKGGVATLHEKWWEPVDPGLRPYLRSWRWRMEGFHEARDALLRWDGH